MLGSTGVVASYIALSSYEIVLLRSGLGFIFLLAIFLVVKKRFTIFQHKKDLLYIASSGVAMGVEWLLLFEAYKQIGVSLGMLINYSGPAIVIAMSVLLFKDYLSQRKAVALLMAFVGTALISGEAMVTDMNLWGLFCAGASAFGYAAMVLLNRQAKEIRGLENATIQLFFGSLVVVLFVTYKQGLYIDIQKDDWLPILCLGFINTGISCYLYFAAIGKLPVQTVSICGYLEPLSAVVFAAIFLHETMLPLQVLGAVLIIGGALLGEYQHKQKQKQGLDLA